MVGDISRAVNIYIVCGYTDMRKSIDGLCTVILEQRPSIDMTDEELSQFAPWSETVQCVCGITK